MSKSSDKILWVVRSAQGGRRCLRAFSRLSDAERHAAVLGGVIAQYQAVPTHIGMSRGFLWLDESVYDLEPWLRALNFKIKQVPSGMPDDQIIESLLSFRIFVTKNPKDFVLSALEYEFGLIGVTDAAMSNPRDVAQAISRAYVERRLQSNIPFKLSIGVSSTVLTPLTNETVSQELAKQKAQKHKPSANPRKRIPGKKTR